MRSKAAASSGLIWLRQFADTTRGRLEQPLVVRLRGDVHGAGVLEHLRLERKRGEVADRADDALGVGDEVLVANLEVARLAHLAPESLRAANLRPPLACEAGRAPRVRPRLRDDARQACRGTRARRHVRRG